MDPGFPGVNRHFVLLFEKHADQTRQTRYFTSSVEIKD